jgi:hypothetical protein
MLMLLGVVGLGNEVIGGCLLILKNKTIAQAISCSVTNLLP